MDNEQLKDLAEALTNVRLDLRELTTEVRGVKELASTVNGMSKQLAAVEASAKSAHLRMDKIEKIHTGLAMTFVGGIIAAIVTFIVKGGLSA